MWVDKAKVFLEHPITWGTITLVLAAIAASGKVSMKLSYIILAIAGIFGCIGISFYTPWVCKFKILAYIILLISLLLIFLFIRPSGAIEMSVEGTAQFNSIYLGDEGGFKSNEKTIVSNFGWFVQRNHVYFTNNVMGGVSKQYFELQSNKKQLNLSVSTDYPKDFPIFIIANGKTYKCIPGAKYLISTATGEIKSCY